MTAASKPLLSANPSRYEQLQARAKELRAQVAQSSSEFERLKLTDQLYQQKLKELQPVLTRFSQITGGIRGEEKKFSQTTIQLNQSLQTQSQALEPLRAQALRVKQQVEDLKAADALIKKTDLLQAQKKKREEIESTVIQLRAQLEVRRAQQEKKEATHKKMRTHSTEFQGQVVQIAKIVQGLSPSLSKTDPTS